jgi:hypothetical protein
VAVDSSVVSHVSPYSATRTWSHEDLEDATISIVGVRSRPHWVIGGGWDGDGLLPGEYEDLYIGSVTGGLITSPTSFVVGDGLRHELIQAQIDREGRLRVNAIGRQGSGPGEFRLVTDLAVCRDSLAVFDAALGRISTFPLPLEAGSEPAITSVSSVISTYGPIYSFACTSDHYIFGVRGLAVGEVAPGPYEVPVSLVAAERATLRASQVLRVGVMERYRFPRGDGPRSLGAMAAVGANTGSAFYYPGRGGSIYRIDPVSSVRVREALPVSDRPRTEADVADLLTERKRDMPESMWPQLEAGAQTYDFPDSIPAFDRLVAATSGAVWVRETTIATESPSRVWYRLGVNGAPPLRLTVKGTLDILDEGHGRLLLLHWTALGEPLVLLSSRTILGA